MGFFYSFSETILHSLWQSCLLFLFYVCVNYVLLKTHPLQKRNFLYILLLTQCIISLGTFSLCFTDSSLSKLLSITKIFSTKNSFFSFLYPYANAIFYIYAFIICVRFSAVYFQWRGFKNNYRKELVRPAATLRIFAELKGYQLGIKKKITIWYSHKIKAPITFGFFKPMILLPFSLINNITTEEVEAIIVHELSHIKSNDYLLNWFLIPVEIFYFFNPFIKILAGCIRLEREKNCDVQVINFKCDPLFYAQILLKIARNNNDVKSFHLGTVTKSSSLLKRIRFFSDERNMTFKKGNSGIFCYLPILFLIAISVLFIPAKDNVLNNTAISNSVTNALETPKYFEVKETIKSKAKENKNIAGEKIYRNKKINIIIPERTFIEDELTENENIYRQASMNETPDSIREIIYNVETQHGKLTQSYKLIMIKGKWILQPQWMLVETNTDSSSDKKADTSANIIHPIQ